MQVETRPHVNRYNPSCLLGNWNEDIYQAEAKLGEFLQQKENGTLMIQRTNRLLNSALTPVSLTPTRDDEYLRGGSVVMIKSAAIKDLYLASSPNIPDTLESNPQVFKSPCLVTATHNSTPCQRNTFVIRTIPELTRYCYKLGERCRADDPILFGQRITISNLDSCGGLMLHSAINDAVNFSRKKKHQEVTLHFEYSSKTHWRILPRDPNFRLELEDTPVPVNMDIVINHVHTNRHLAIEMSKIRTVFGPDYEVSVHRYMDQYHVEEVPNVWKIVASPPLPVVS